MRPMNQPKPTAPRLLSAGYLTMDTVVRDLSTGHYWHAAGGTTGNVSTFASALGIQTTMLARVGEDHRASHILRFLSEAGVDTSRIERVPRLRTPGIIELIRGTPEGAHQFTYTCPACQTRLPKDAVVSKRRADTEAQTIDQFDALFFDRATPSTVRLAEAAQNAGLIVMFEPSSIPRTTIAENAAALSDIVKISLKPSQRPGRWHPAQEAHTRFIVETLGAQGVSVRSKLPQGWSAPQEWPAVPQEVIRDAAGAGDWLSAGILYSLLQARDTITTVKLEQSIKYGMRLSAISLAFDGPQGALKALGAKAIQRISQSPYPLKIPCEEGSDNTAAAKHKHERLHHCDICLTSSPEQ